MWATTHKLSSFENMGVRGQSFLFWPHLIYFVCCTKSWSPSVLQLLCDLVICLFVVTSLWSCHLLICCNFSVVLSFAYSLSGMCYLIPLDPWILQISDLGLNFLKLHLWAEGRECTGQGVSVEVRRQLSGVSSLLLTYGSLNSDYQTWWVVSAFTC